MEFLSLGGINEHGRNCFLLKGENSILLDCGLSEEGEPPFFSQCDVKKISALFLTHSHDDHVGALKQLFSLGFQGMVYLSKPTYDARKIKDFPHVFLVPGEERKLPFLSLLPLRSGHCFGSLSFQISREEKKILYTGDYLEDSIFSVDPIRGKEADLAIVDGAYKEAKSREESKKELLSLIKEKEKVLLPLPRNGRSREVISLLEKEGIDYDIASPYFREEEEVYLKHRVERKPKKGASVLLLHDPQAEKEETKKAIESHTDYALIFTGTIDKGSQAEQYRKERKDTFFVRIPVHQTIREAKKLIEENRFKNAIIFHNKETKEKTSLVF